MDDLTSFVGSEDKQTQGVEFHYPGTQSYFTVASSLQKKYRNYLAQRMARERRKTRKADLDPEAQDKIMVEGMAKFLLKSWRGVGENGKAIEVNHANAVSILTKSAPIRDFVAACADDNEQFGITAGESEGAEEDLKSGAPVVS